MAAESTAEETQSLPAAEAAGEESKPGVWQRFRRWRSGRPFVPGLLLILSGIIIAAPAYITIHISDLLVMISTISGVSTLLIGILLVMFGLGAWFQPATSNYVGVLGIIVAIIALPTSNLGGFVIGSLLGIIGGAFTFAWQPGEKKRREKETADQ